jgi:hypothetical protein
MSYDSTIQANPAGTLQQLQAPQSGALYNLGGTTLQGAPTDALVSNQLDTLMRGDNPMVSMARSNAANYAAARGAGVDSASYGYNAEQAALAAMSPIAQANAQEIAQVNAANQGALNTTAANRLQANTEAGIAQTNRASAMDQLRQQQTFQAAQNLQNRAWQVADQGTQAQAQARSQFFGNMESSMFSDPSFWQDPQGMMGAFNEYGSNFNSLFDSMFPEYGEMQAGGNVPTNPGNTTGGSP